MTKDEALRLALEALENIDRAMPFPVAKLAIKECKAALEAKDEPVEFFDWYDNAHWGNEDFKEGCHRAWNAAIKYTTPPQRTWVGLTNQELSDCWDTIPERAMKQVEAKLKDKNT